MSAGFEVSLARAAQHDIAELPTGVAFAAIEFISTQLTTQPLRVGKRLTPPYGDQHSARRGTFRILYVVNDEARTVTVISVRHRRDAYRS